METGKYVLAWVGAPAFTDNFSVRAIASAGHTEYLEDLKHSWRGPDSYNSAVTVAILLGTVQVATYTNPRDTSTTPVKRSGLTIRSSCALPIITSDGVIAALAVYAETEDAFGTSELIELRALVDELAYDIELLRDRQKGAAQQSSRAQRHTRLGIFAFDVDTEQVFLLTREMYDILGVSSDNWDRNLVEFVQLVAPDEREHVETSLRNVVSTSHCEFVLHVLRPDGEPRTLQVVAELAPGEGDESSQVVCTCVDVTNSIDLLDEPLPSPTSSSEGSVGSEFSHSPMSSLMTIDWPNSAIRRNEVEQVVLSDILDCVEDAVVAIDVDGRVMGWNRGAELLYGISYEQAFAASVSEVLPSAAEELVRMLKDDSAERVDRSEIQRTRRDGQQLVVEETLSPIRNVKGRVFGVLSRARNLAPEKKSQYELDVARQELELRDRRLQESSEELERFAYVTAYDLAEPLRAITGMVSLLERKYHDQLGDDANEYLRHTSNACSRMRAMIANLQNFAATGSGTPPSENVELNRVLDIAMSNMVLELDRFDLELNVGDLASVHANRTLLIQVFENVLRHSLSSHDEGEHIAIEVTSNTSEAGCTKVTVVTRSVLQDIERPTTAVQMLQRPHARNTFAGTGLDLAIAARIVNAHGGDFGSHRDVEASSTIWFTLAPSRESE
jgi:PAS domain S-box-containing protein